MTQHVPPFFAPLGQPATYSGVRDAILEIETTGTGNTVLRIGRKRPGDRTFLQIAHIILSPADVAALQAALNA